MDENKYCVFKVYSRDCVMPDFVTGIGYYIDSDGNLFVESANETNQDAMFVADAWTAIVPEKMTGSEDKSENESKGA